MVILASFNYAGPPLGTVMVALLIKVSGEGHQPAHVPM
jgi:hypothetical protein